MGAKPSPGVWRVMPCSVYHFSAPGCHFTPTFSAFSANTTTENGNIKIVGKSVEFVINNDENNEKTEKAMVAFIECGDFNIAHRAIDLARPKQNEKNTGFLPEERAFLDRFTDMGYVDTFRHVHGDVEGRYSWWSYKMRAREKNVGWRIDYFFVSEELKPYIRDAWIEDDVYGSDHCPVGLELDI